MSFVLKTGKIVPAAGMAAVIGHITATAWDNLPDQHVSLSRVHRAFTNMPTWRFFGPNPGVDNMHLAFRTGEDAHNLGDWAEIETTPERPWWAVMWNPGTRGPKTLFDVCQQIKRLSATTHGNFDAVKKSEPYALLADYVLAHAPSQRYVQFTLLAARPGHTHSRAQTVVTSSVIDTEGITTS